MDPFAPMADQLQARPPAPPPPQKREGISDRLRQHLRDNGGCTARELAEAAGLPDSGKISAILKKDRRCGRVLLVDGVYSWNENYVAPAPPCGGRVLVRDVLDWREVADGEFPDVDLCVLGRLRDNDEPVWIVHFDGEEWRDTDGQVVDVVRWCDIPKGGEV